MTAHRASSSSLPANSRLLAVVLLATGSALIGCTQKPTSVAAVAASSPVPSSSDPLVLQAQALFKPIPDQAPELPGNAASKQKVELGKMLYFEPRLSANHAISCSSCHNLGLGGADIASTSLGHRSQKGGRNSPTVFNAAFNTAQFWDGRAKDLEEQAGGPLVNPVEMASPATHVTEQLKGIPGYLAFFSAAFPGEADPITLPNVQKAIAVFEATLLTPGAPFDRFLKGDAGALSETQKAGLTLFLGKGCAGCHSGINIGGGMYAPFGIAKKPGAELLPPEDKGRFAVTKSASDEYVYKVPSLRNIAITAPYFHTGQVWDLREAVTVMGTTQLGNAISSDEADKLVAFLGALTGTPPSVTVPVLPPTVANTPRPQP
jgi:cytochrome c peroxidase